MYEQKQLNIGKIPIDIKDKLHRHIAMIFATTGKKIVVRDFVVNAIEEKIAADQRDV